jgi:BA14K-like protein
MKRIVAAGIAGLTLAGSVLPAQADHWRYRYYGRPYYYRHDNGAAVAAGVAGLAAGALIAGAIANQAAAAPPPPPGTVNPNLAAYCARKYRSYDPMTGTFLARSGERIVCTY